MTRPRIHRRDGFSRPEFLNAARQRPPTPAARLPRRGSVARAGVGDVVEPVRAALDGRRQRSSARAAPTPPQRAHRVALRLSHAFASSGSPHSQASGIWPPQMIVIGGVMLLRSHARAAGRRRRVTSANYAALRRFGLATVAGSRGELGAALGPSIDHGDRGRVFHTSLGRPPSCSRPRSATEATSWSASGRRSPCLLCPLARAAAPAPLVELDRLDTSSRLRLMMGPHPSGNPEPRRRGATVMFFSLWATGRRVGSLPPTAAWARDRHPRLQLRCASVRRVSLTSPRLWSLGHRGREPTLYRCLWASSRAAHLERGRGRSRCSNLWGARDAGRTPPLCPGGVVLPPPLQRAWIPGAERSARASARAHRARAALGEPFVPASHCTSGASSATAGRTSELGSSAQTRTRRGSACRPATWTIVQALVGTSTSATRRPAGRPRHVRICAERAHAELGWRATTSFADGVARYVEWLAGTNGSPELGDAPR